jgi:signal transduction histidine kinase
LTGTRQTQAIRDGAATLGDGRVQIVVSNEASRCPPMKSRACSRNTSAAASPHKPGAGLGLYLVQRIATLHGGQVTLASAGANGTISFALHPPA